MNSSYNNQYILDLELALNDNIQNIKKIYKRKYISQKVVFESIKESNECIQDNLWIINKSKNINDKKLNIIEILIHKGYINNTKSNVHFILEVIKKSIIENKSTNYNKNKIVTIINYVCKFFDIFYVLNEHFTVNELIYYLNNS